MGISDSDIKKIIFNSLMDQVNQEEREKIDRVVYRVHEILTEVDNDKIRCLAEFDLLMSLTGNVGAFLQKTIVND